MLTIAWKPVAPTTAAMAPKAPTGASHMIMIRMRKTRAWTWPMALRTGAPWAPIFCRAKPTRMAARSVGQHRDVARDDAKQEVDGAVRCGLLVGLVRRQLQALARVDEVADDQADGQREGGHEDEVAQGQPADLADRGGLGDGADAQHDGAEDDRGDHHLDQFDEPVAQRLQRLADLREQQPDHGAQDDGDDDGDVKVVGLVESLALRPWPARLTLLVEKP